MIEEWRDIIGYEGLYQVSDAGNVRALDRAIICKGSNRTRIYKGRNMRATKDFYGYRRVTLCRAGNSKDLRVHNLVLAAFIGPRPDGHEACHNNGIRDDNRPANLRWDTRKGNASDRAKHGTCQAGDQNNHARLTAADVIHIRKRAADGIKQATIARELSLSEQLVSRIVLRKRWSHI